MKTIYLYIVAVALIAGSCKKSVVELQNPSAYDYYTYFDSPKRINEAVIATYAVFLHPGMYSRDYYYIFDLLGNDAEASDVTLNRPPQDLWKLYRYKFYDKTNKNIGWLWASLYRMVLRANVVIDRIGALRPSVQDPDDLNSLDQYQAEASFLRGYAYFQLVTLWGRVPLRKSYKESIENKRPPRADTSAIWAFIVQDLKYAKAHLPDKDDAELGRATRGAAAVLLGKSYLYRKDWSNARIEIDALYNGSYNQYGFSGQYDEEDGLFGTNNQNNDEIIFQVMHGKFNDGEYYYSEGLQESSDGGPVTHSYRAWEYGFADMPRMRVSPQLVNSFTYPVNGIQLPPDPRAEYFFYGTDAASGVKTTYCRNCGDSVFTKAGFWWKKYEYYEDVPKYDDPQSSINSVVIRFADVLLMLAEANIRLGRLDEARDLINELRSHAKPNDPLFLYDNSSFSNQSQAMQILMHERQIELCGEQSRFFDLVRWNILKSTLQNEGIIIEEKQKLLPIPQQEISTNPNVANDIQNDWN